MNDQELDLENVNEIDMECNIADDDDSFGNIASTAINNSDHNITDTSYNYANESEERPLQSRTGIMINLSDDEDARPIKTITADINLEGNLNISKNYSDTDSDIDNDMHDYNEIDMETPFADDTEEDYLAMANEEDASPIFDDQEDGEVVLEGLVDEDIIEEKRKKKKVTQGEVEADYWKKMQKKHAASNKKGAYNSYFHLAGNPKLEQELFNHDMNPNSTSNAWAAPYGPDGASSPSSITGSVAGEAAASGDAGGGEGGGCSESLLVPKTNPYTDKFERCMDLIGFDIFKNSDETYSAFDRCESNNDIEGVDKDTMLVHIMPCVETCIVYPLEVMTNQKFDNHQDWIDWYKDNKDNYPEYEEDIDCLDILNNHLEECFE